MSNDQPHEDQLPSSAATPPPSLALRPSSVFVNLPLPPAVVASKKPTIVKRRPCKKSRSHKPLGMPRRPLSAYNLFFREERTKLLADKARWCPVATGEGEDRPDGGLFALMGKEISARWKQVDPADMERYQEQARLESQRYKREMDEYTKKTAKMVAEGKAADKKQQKRAKALEKEKRRRQHEAVDADDAIKVTYECGSQASPPPAATSFPSEGSGGGYFVITPVLPSPDLASYPQGLSPYGSGIPPPVAAALPPAVADLKYPSFSNDILLQRLAMVQQEQQQLLLYQRLVALQKQQDCLGGASSLLAGLTDLNLANQFLLVRNSQSLERAPMATFLPAPPSFGNAHGATLNLPSFPLATGLHQHPPLPCFRTSGTEDAASQI